MIALLGITPNMQAPSRLVRLYNDIRADQGVLLGSFRPACPTKSTPKRRDSTYAYERQILGSCSPITMGIYQNLNMLSWGYGHFLAVNRRQ